MIENLPWMPVQITQATVDQNAVGVPPQLKASEITFQNTAGKKVMLLGVTYNSRNDQGVDSRGSCAAYMSIFPDQPVIASGGTRIEKPSIRIPANSKLVPVIDLVLLEDGSAYGPDQCGALQDYQSNLGSRRATIAWVLRQLGTIGPQKTEEVLKQKLALRDKVNPAPLNPKFIRRK